MISACITLIVLSLFVAILTRTKLQRINKAQEQFRKIKILTSNFELDVHPEFEEIFRTQMQDQDFLDGVEGAVPAS